ELVIVGNVCRRDNPESVAAHERSIPAISLPEALRVFFLTGRRPLVVTGTHGKTTTSSILAWMLEHGGLDPGFMIGGITGNFGSSFKLGQGNPFVVEGDEYDTAWFDKVPKFWHYAPLRATINNIEFDHGDIYPDLASIVSVFERLAALVDPQGSLWVNGDDPRARAVAQHAKAPVFTFGLGPDNDLRATHIDHDPEQGLTTATLTRDGQPIGQLRSPMLGEHNIRNALGALALATDEGLTAQACLDALLHFKSVRKRQELRGVVRGVRVYDDFAHHPTAVRETLRALRTLHPDAPLWGIFEAKSNTSRMAIFQEDYPQAFAPCTQVILSAPWRKDSHLRPEQKLDLQRVVADLGAMGIPARFIPTVPEIVETLATELQPGDVVAGLSGSNFSGFHDLLIERLSQDVPPSEEST
ncbi:MAG: Mur ligase family protein, partial [Myxococcota bacterium]